VGNNYNDRRLSHWRQVNRAWWEWVEFCLFICRNANGSRHIHVG